MATFTGTSADDTFSGGPDNDSASGGDGNDTLIGDGGNDILAGDSGADTLNGGDGDDTLYAGSISPDWQIPFFENNPDFVAPALDRDGIADTLIGGAGVDRIFAGYRDTIDGGADLADLLISFAGASSGLTLDFRAVDNHGTVTIGDTSISSIRAVLWIEGSDFDDTIIGSNAGDGSGSTYAPIFGLGGNDHLVAGLNTGNIYGGDGNDLIEVSQSPTGISTSGTYYGDAGDDVITVTGDGVFFPYGSAFGGDGNDTLTLAGSLSGGAGNDTINILYVFNYTTVAKGDEGDDTINDSIQSDTLYGGDGADLINGNGGDDHIYGDAGDDTIIGGSGVDALAGGSGADVFRGTSAELNTDTITDFAAGDRIVLTDATLAGFTFSLTGNTLTFTGGSLTLSSVPAGTIVASAAAGGGVELKLLAHDPDNDFNGDGKSDILWRSDAGQFSDWLGQANGGFLGNDVNASTGVPTNWSIAGSGDFNGDGRDDVLWRSDSGQLSDWLGQPNGGFLNNDTNALIGVPTSWHVAGVGDFNGDGRDDLLWRSDSGQLSDWLGQTNGGFANNDANAFTGVPTSWHVVGTGDFNGDGRDDILWRSDTGQLSDWLGQANGGFIGNDSNAFTSVPTSWHVVGTGDFNGDGRDDILWRSGTGQLSDWLGQANGGFANNDAHAFTSVPTDWNVVDIGDYNGDGRDDVLWRSDSGLLSNWLGQANGGFANNDAHAFTNVPTTWHVQSPDSLWL